MMENGGKCTYKNIILSKYVFGGGGGTGQYKFGKSYMKSNPKFKKKIMKTFLDYLTIYMNMRALNNVAMENKLIT